MVRVCVNGGACGEVAQPSFNSLHVFTRSLDLQDDLPFHYDWDGERVEVRDDEQFDVMLQRVSQSQRHVLLLYQDEDSRGGRKVEYVPLAADEDGREQRSLSLVIDVAMGCDLDTPEASPSASEDEEEEEEILLPGVNVREEKFISCGTSGSCYLGRTTGGRLVVVKGIAIPPVKDTDFQQIERELEVLKKCRECESIVRLLSSCIDHDIVYLFFEHLDYGNLKRLGIVPLSVMRKVVLNIASALQFIHNLRIIHRDVKRDNILVSSKGEFKLCDFGVSRELEENCTVAVTFNGTKAYMAPERLSGGAYRCASDVWALGVLVFECATDEHPFMLSAASNDAVSYERRVMTSHAPVQHVSSLQYTEHLQTLVHACTHPDASLRWSAEEVLLSPFILSFINDVDKDQLNRECVHFLHSHDVECSVQEMNLNGSP